jgi:carboxyl-terminal processing protease
MMPASTRGIGMATGFPDVCNTPNPAGTAPVPYPNVADHSAATGTVTNVRINMLDAHNQLTTIPTSSGDEAGVAHPTIKGAQTYTMGHPNIRLNMMPAITLASLTAHNNMNCPVGAVLVPSAPNVRFNLADARGAAPAGVLAPHDSEEHLAAALGRGVELGSDGTILVRSISMAFGAELAEAARERLAAGDVVLRVDLRACRGGVVSGAVDAAGLFVPRGEVIARIVDEDGDEIVERSRSGALAGTTLVLTIGPRTASAAELFAGALALAGCARLEGTRTRGKGSDGELVDLGDGRFAMRAVGEVRLADGTPIAGRGVEPTEHGR